MTEQSSLKPVDLNADQALGMVSFGLMQRLAQDGQVDLPWLEASGNADSERLRQLRQRLELTSGWNAVASLPAGSAATSGA